MKNMSYDESEWNEEIDNPENLLKNIKGYEGIEEKIQCRVCFNMFSKGTEFMLHIKIHTEQFALDFIKKYQPVSANIIFKKFKNLAIDEMEKRKLVKFSDEFMGWCLPDFVFNKKKLRFDSLVNAPCFSCQYEKICEISNEKINPLNCSLIENWVNNKFVNKKDSVQKSENHIETLEQAEYWCKKNKKFDIIGKIERNKNQNSPNKFIFIDKLDIKKALILKLSDEKKMALGKNIIIKNVKLTGKSNMLVIDATLSDSFIEIV